VQILAVALELLHELGGYSVNIWNKDKASVQILDRVIVPAEITLLISPIDNCLCGTGFILVFTQMLLFYDLKPLKYI
jgi:hypothetical protein